MKNLHQRLFFLFILCMSFTVQAQMELVFNTNNISGTTIGIPLSDSVNVIIDWGNGISTPITSAGYIEHTYSQNGIYTVTVNGYLEWLGSDSLNPSIKALEHVINFGDLGIRSLKNSFKYADSLKSVPNEIPTTVENLSGCFRGINQTSILNLENWNLENVINISGMFRSTDNFNQDIGNWNVQNVIDMSWMFCWATSFNQNISNWDVGNVEDMSSMFRNAYSFNQGIDDWNVSNVNNMRWMFNSAFSFNGNINNWDVSNVEDMYSMFNSAQSFNQDIGNWNVSNVTTMEYMFWWARDFNQDIGDWDVSNVTNMNYMFYQAYTFNQDIGDWNVGNATTMHHMFTDAHNFNQDIGDWDVSNVIVSMVKMFCGATTFNQDLSDWCVEQFTNYPFDFSYNCPLLEEYHPHWGEECFVGINNTELENLIVYPNPTKSIINIDKEPSEIYEIIIYNQFNQLLFKTNNKERIVDISNFQPGIYILEIITYDHGIRKKIIKE